MDVQSRVEMHWWTERLKGEQRLKNRKSIGKCDKEMLSE